MRPKRLEWHHEDDSNGESAKVFASLGNFDVSVFPDGNRWNMWIARKSPAAYVLLKSIQYDTKAEAKLAGEQIWRRMVMELLEGDE
jgi:hypothetical protein